MVLWGGVVAVCFEGLLRGHVLAGGPASQPQPPVERLHEGLGGLGVESAARGERWSAHSAPSRRWSDATRINALFVFWFCGGALLPFVLRACCGSMCWPVDRPATHAAAGAAARGVRGWGVESAARGGRRSAHSAPSRRWSDATRINALFVFWFCGGALLPFVLRACCGSMCWPVDRPATHAAAGAAARGVRGIGGRIRCAGRPQEWSCGSVPPQERWHEGGWFLFFLWGLLRCREGDCFTRSGEGVKEFP